MKHWKRHISLNLLNKIFVLTLLLFFFGCKKEKVEEKVVAKVNSSVLTDTELNDALGRYKNKSRYREEYIRDWVKNELLYQEAISQSITEGEEYKNLAELVTRKLAAGLYLNKYIESVTSQPSDFELRQYYIDTREDFRIFNNGYVINRINFTDDEAASAFRKSALNNGWKSALHQLEKSKVVKSTINNDFIYEHQITPPFFFRILKNLRGGEVSVVIELEPQVFTIVQMVKKFPGNSIPDFKFIKNEVKSRYTALQSKKLVEQHLESLYSRHNIVINRDNE